MSETSELIAKQIMNGNINKKSWGDLLFNVKVYGASGDGVTDDSAAFNRAVSALKESGGGVLRVPPGKYVLLSPVMISNTNISIEGAGILQTVIFCNGCDGIVYTNTNSFQSYFNASNFTLVTLQDNLYKGIQVSLPSNSGSAWRNVYIENVTLCGTTSIAAFTDGSNNSQVSTQNWNRAIYLNNCAVSVLKDVVVRSGDDATGGFAFYTEGTTTDILIQGCKVYTVQYGVYKIGLSEGIIIDNCMFINVGTGVMINQNAAAPSGVYASVTNCHINYKTSGIVAFYHPQVAVSNCLIYKQGATSGTDINLISCGYSRIINNTLLVNAGGGSADGIVINGDSNTLIEGNTIAERGTGIWIRSGTTSAQIIGNRMTLNTANILDQGTDTYIQKRVFSSTNLITPSGTSFNADIAIPSGFLTTKPTSGFLMSSGTEDILGFYDYDSASSTATNARFRLVRKDGAAFSGVATRFNVVVYE